MLNLYYGLLILLNCICLYERCYINEVWLIDSLIEHWINRNERRFGVWWKTKERIDKENFSQLIFFKSSTKLTFGSSVNYTGFDANLITQRKLSTCSSNLNFVLISALTIWTDSFCNCCVWWTGWTVSQQRGVKVSTGPCFLFNHTERKEDIWHLNYIEHDWNHPFPSYSECDWWWWDVVFLSVPLSLIVFCSLRTCSVHCVDWRFG